ncbi:MAG: hypothetical protein JJ878_19335 [Alphaproteobacteria bacterium]|nr:hypothetical protein [Alphaproteobacteria bacterium]MBO6864781.1 hypothetical protein [Alphaproteobacteria bacterium]
MDIQANQDVFILIILFGILALVFFRGRRKRKAEPYRIAYIGHSETADNAGEAFRTTFGDMLPDDPAGAVLLRVSLMNRSDTPVAPEEFLRPVIVTLPEDSRVLLARAAQSSSSVAPETVAVQTRLNQVEIAPFPMPNRSSMIFNIVVDGPATPYAVDGAFQQQARLEPLE